MLNCESQAGCVKGHLAISHNDVIDVCPIGDQLNILFLFLIIVGR